MLSYTCLVSATKTKHYSITGCWLLQNFSVWFSAITATAAGYTAEHLAAVPVEPGEYQVKGQGVDKSLTQAPGTSTFHVQAVFFFFNS